MTADPIDHVRIGTGQGSSDDAVDAAFEVITHGSIRFLCLQALSELTLTHLQEDLERDPALGYVEDLPARMARLLPACHTRGIRIVTNAGGLNPRAAARAVRRVAEQCGLHDLRIGVVTGDDLLYRFASIAPHIVGPVNPPALKTGAGSQEFTRAPKATSPPESALRPATSLPQSNAPTGELVSASATLGAQPIVKALDLGCDVVITGRIAGSALFLGPAVHALGWAWTDWDLLATGTVMGHLLESAGQVCGGNWSGAWDEVPTPWRIGYPIADLTATGRLLITKPPDTGGLVTPDTVAEQLLYRIHDPRATIAPDVVVDLGATTLETRGPDCVRVRDVRGHPAPQFLRLVVGHHDGWMSEGRIGYCWPDATEKARHAATILAHRFEAEGIEPLETVTELEGVNSLLGRISPPPPYAPEEVFLRVAVRTRTREQAEQAAREFTRLRQNGPPGGVLFEGTSPPRKLVRTREALLAREIVESAVTVEVNES